MSLILDLVVTDNIAFTFIFSACILKKLIDKIGNIYIEREKTPILKIFKYLDTIMFDRFKAKEMKEKRYGKNVWLCKGWSGAVCLWASFSGTPPLVNANSQPLSIR